MLLFFIFGKFCIRNVLEVERGRNFPWRNRNCSAAGSIYFTKKKRKSAVSCSAVISILKKKILTRLSASGIDFKNFGILESSKMGERRNKERRGGFFSIKSPFKFLVTERPSRMELLLQNLYFGFLTRCDLY